MNQENSKHRIERSSAKKELAKQQSNYKLNVLYEDNHLIVINKQPGILVQGDKTGDKPLVEMAKEYIKKKYKKEGAVFLGVPHRIDRPVSGIVIFARTSKSLVRVNEMFQKKEIKKTYWAVVKNRPPQVEDKLVHYLVKNQEKNRSKAYIKQKKNTTRCELDYKLIGASKQYRLLEIDPKTGRHHQIRVQLATIGCPIKGDIKYGFDRPNKDKSIHLHARKIEFIHPVTKENFSVTAPAPNDVVWNIFK